MIHDLDLIDKISRLHKTTFDGCVFRVTGIGADPTAASTNGGRWAPPPNEEPSFPVLYCSLEKDGAIAEVASYLAEQTPMPAKGLRVHELVVTASETLTLGRLELGELGVDPSQYGERNYWQTQKIGAVVNFLGMDGLLVPSARWKCENLIIFTDNHSLNEKLESRDSEIIDWQAWARSFGVIKTE